MKIVLAFDKFKGSLTGTEANASAFRGVRAALPDADISSFPCADGGEGTVEAFLSCGLTKRICNVTPPHEIPGNSRISAVYACDADTAVMEMASSSGLSLVPPALRNPLNTSTYGLGEMILDALDAGCRRFLIGIGGSATNDCGIGMASALGAQFRAGNGRKIFPVIGRELQQIEKIDLSRMDPRLKECTFTACCDVDNPLYGECGAAQMFAAQKGADTEAIRILDEGLRHFAGVIARDHRITVSDLRGAGAAGGLGAGIVFFLRGTLTEGFRAAAEASGLFPAIRTADLVLTGEGSIDMQTVHGKAVCGVIRAAKETGIPVFAFGGKIDEDAEDALYASGADGLFALPDGPMDLPEAMRQADRLLARTVRAAVTAFSAHHTEQSSHKE